MKAIFLSVILLFIVSTGCDKQGADALRSDGVNTNLLLATDTLRIPINDLGTGTYYGYMGGLYPGGKNSPSGQYKKDLKLFANSIKPLSGNGTVDSGVGKICFVSLGGSISGHMMDSLKQKTLRDTTTNPYLKLLNCSNGGGVASFENIADPNDDYWNHVSKVLVGGRATYKQVQVVYLESEDSLKITGFPKRPKTVKDNIEAAIRTCKAKFVNLKLVYLLGRTTTFPDSFTITMVTNKEPCPYYNGWACKFAIEDQIHGKPGTEYKGDSAVAPMVTWGWYQWADGTTNPRNDGFVWLPSETADGLHANDEGQDTLSTRFRNFLLTDPVAKIWYTE